MFEKIKEHLTYYLSSLALLNAAAFSGFAMSQSELEEIVVTARKKTESLQDVPISVSALRESDLEDKGVNVFEDYNYLWIIKEKLFTKLFKKLLRAL